MVSGVIAGICEYFGWGRDVVTILRILFIVLAFSSMGGLIPLYFVASWIIPSGYRSNNQSSRQGYNEYENRWEEKANRWSEKMERKASQFEEKMNRKAQRWEDKSNNYEDKWSQGPWNSTKQSNNWGNPWEEPQRSERKMKEAEPVKDDKKDDWSDF